MRVNIPRIHGCTVVSRTGTRPVSASDFCEHAKIDSTLIAGESGASFKAYLEMLIDSAVSFAEKYTGLILIEGTSMIAYLDQFRPYQSYQLMTSPVTSITSIRYYVDGSLETIDSGSYYIVSSNGWPRIYLTDGYDWPSDCDYRAQAIQIAYAAGYAAATFPDDLKLAIMQHTLQMYSSRGDCETSSNVSCSLPLFSANTYSGYKIRTVGIVV